MGYTYDLRGLQTKAAFDGIAGAGVSNAYDAFGRLTSTTTSLGGVSRTVSHLHDRDGLESETTFPDGQKFWTARDGLGRPSGLYHDPLGSTSTRLVAFAWDAASRLSRLTRYPGDRTDYGYHGVGLLASIEDNFPGGAGGTRSEFDYNPAGQLAGETRTNIAYAWTGSAPVHRNYGVNGQNQYTHTVSDASLSATFAYDSNGNLTSDGATSFVYDSENRLVSASGAKNAELLYDPLGRLFQIASPATGVTQFLYDGDELVAEYNGAGALLRRYLHGDGSDDPLMWYEGPIFDQPRYLHSDRRGSITAIAGAGGALLSINTYDEYGIPGASNVGRFQYTGQAWMAELGMYYYKARIYSPTLGRFMQTDPIGYEDQINLYAYVGNDPVNGNDPTGTSCAPAGTQKGGAPAYECKVDVVATVERKNGQFVVTGERPVNEADGNKFDEFNATYTEAANAASRQAYENPGSVVTVEPFGPDNVGSFTTTSANMLREMRERRVSYANKGPSNAAMATLGGSNMGRTPTTFVYDNGLRSTQGGICS